jgi:hypothetical protein
MTDAAGAIIDDGVACRLADRYFFVTATTSGVDAAVRAMRVWNTQWELDVDISNVTTAYAAINLAGPRSREILRELCHDIDLAPSAFPYMGVREGHVAHIPARVLRVGFVGELGFEIHAPASCGEQLWDAAIERGRQHGIVPRRSACCAWRRVTSSSGRIRTGSPTPWRLEWRSAASPSSSVPPRSRRIGLARRAGWSDSCWTTTPGRCPRNVTW